MDYYEKYLKYKNKYKNLKKIHGGMKIVINDNVSRDLITVKQFEDIFRYATNIEIVSVDSLTGFIFRIKIPENITIFRSDIIDTDGKLMNLQSNMLPNTGVKIVDVIFKICIIQEKRGPKINNFNSINKISCTLQKLKDEYNTQRKIYDTSMINGGIPVCPDVISLLIFSKINFQKLFIESQSCNLSNIFSENPVFQYINREIDDRSLPIIRSVGIILMESLPSTYKQLYILKKDIMQKDLFLEMSKRVFANFIIIFYRSGIILLDAHLKNWMFDNCQYFNQFKVKAIDFGRFIDINTQLNIIEMYSRQYFESAEQDIMQNFAVLMDHDTSNVTDEDDDDDYDDEYDDEDVSKMLVDELISLNYLIKSNLYGQILWQSDGAPPINIIISDTKVMQIDSCMILIHRILVLSSYIDYFHNMFKFNKNFGQMKDLFNVLFRNRCDNFEKMMDYNLGINLVNYLNMISPEAKEFTILAYMDIKEYIKNYLEPTLSRR
jgi:hypothetical protein